MTPPNFIHVEPVTIFGDRVVAFIATDDVQIYAAETLNAPPPHETYLDTLSDEEIQDLIAQAVYGTPAPVVCRQGGEQ